MIIVPGRSLSVSRRKIVAPRRKQLGYMGFYAAGAMGQGSGGGGPTDPYWANVVSLLHFDGTDGATSIVDQKSRSWTNFGLSLDTSQSRFGPSSLICDGVTGRYINTASSADFAFGTGDFTIEFFLRVVSVALGFQIMFDGREEANSVPRPTIFLTGSTLNYFVSGAVRASGGAVSTNNWYHIALSRVSGSTRMFLSGNQVGSTWSDSTNYEACPITVANAGHSPFDAPVAGWIDEVRVTKGVGRYSANFTQPSAPFPNG